ncbi:MAG: inositol monophosphatase family protein [Gammaproteobacteria bacterium]|jgi:myo-inositol-1(or 4)-monophosphatase
MNESPISVPELEEFALELARLAGSIALANFRRNVDIKNKDAAGFDPVTSADHAIEQILRTTILERYPDHGIVGEEQGRTESLSPYTWYVDPIDGTRAFMMGSPLWGTLVGLTVDSQPRFGLMVQPVLEEVFLGTPASSWLIKPTQRRRLAARACTALADAALASTHPDLFDENSAAAFDHLARRCLLNRWGGDCYNYAMLAAGYVDLVVEDQLKPFDIVPLIPILQGSGCVVTDWTGAPALGGGKVLAAATPELHAAALQVLSGG